jgi:hypothetical protein
MIDPPIHLAVLCNAGGFSAQEIKLSSCGSDNQAIFLCHKCDPQNGATAQIQSDKNENLVAIGVGISGNSMDCARIAGAIRMAAAIVITSSWPNHGRPCDCGGARPGRHRRPGRRSPDRPASSAVGEISSAPIFFALFKLNPGSGCVSCLCVNPDGLCRSPQTATRLSICHKQLRPRWQHLGRSRLGEGAGNRHRRSACRRISQADPGCGVQPSRAVVGRCFRGQRPRDPASLQSATERRSLTSP